MTRPVGVVDSGVGVGVCLLVLEMGGGGGGGTRRLHVFTWKTLQSQLPWGFHAGVLTTVLTQTRRKKAEHSPRDFSIYLFMVIISSIVIEATKRISWTSPSGTLMSRSEFLYETTLTWDSSLGADNIANENIENLLMSDTSSVSGFLKKNHEPEKSRCTRTTD